MAARTDFIVADRSDAKRIVDERDAFTGINANGMDAVRLGKLYGLLTGADYDPAFMTTEDSFAYVATTDGPWVQIVPDDMVRRLAGLSAFDITQYGDEWFKTEEFDAMYSNWTRDDVATFLSQLEQLAAQAVAEDKALYMYTSA